MISYKLLCLNNGKGSFTSFSVTRWRWRDRFVPLIRYPKDVSFLSIPIPNFSTPRSRKSLSILSICAVMTPGPWISGWRGYASQRWAQTAQQPVYLRHKHKRWRVRQTGFGGLACIVTVGVCPSQYGKSLYENYKTSMKKAAITTAWTNRTAGTTSIPSTPSPTTKG